MANIILDDDSLDEDNNKLVPMLLPIPFSLQLY